MGKGLRKEDSLALKGLAVCLMVYSHCYRVTDKFAQYDVVFRGITQDQAIAFAQYCKICVALFAFVSGYGLMYGYSRILRKESSQTPSKWTLQHLISTMSGYWFIVPIAYVLYGIFRGFSFSRWGATYSERILKIAFEFFGLSELLGTKSINGSWWYISAAIAYIILVPFLAAIIEKFGGFACMALIFIFPRCLGIEYQGGNSVYAFLMTMTLGMVCCKYDVFTKFREFRLIKDRRTAQVLRCVVLMGLVIFGYLTYPLVSHKLLWEYNFVLTPFIVILFCVEFLFKIPVVSGVLTFLGKHSMNIWLIHTFVRDWIGEVVFAVREFWLVPIFMIVISLIAGFILDYLKKVTGYNRLVQTAIAKLK